jgi:peptidoglycan/LPS O-acetylase OafA/YrhL
MDAGSSSPRAHTAFSYRPGLDGVRALAVLAVILYHGKVSWAHGGFLGVDVFFVLSGFLITSLLISERDRSGRIDLVGFWTRRARRLLPALFLVLVGVAVYAVVWAQPTELSKLRSDGLATLLYASNWKFIFEGTSYFQAFQTPSPLAHTWSLAIEEQWYLLWPLALPLVLRMCRGRRKVTAAFIGTCAIGSAALMAVLFHAGSRFSPRGANLR